MRKKKILFGPFVGEFGWEILFWQGWVKRIIAFYGQDVYEYYVCGYSGRKALYPDCVNFIDLPKDFISKGYSARGYIMDGWFNGYPGYLPLKIGKSTSPERLEVNLLHKNNHIIQILKNIKSNIYEKKTRYNANIYSEVEIIANSIVKKYEIDVVYSPYKIIKDPLSGYAFGTNIEDVKNQFYSNKIKMNAVKFIYQDTSCIGTKNVYLPTKEKIICIFPRNRAQRRSDKNWTKDKYIELINGLQKAANNKIYLLGEPGSCYFDDQVPPKCIDYINIDSRVEKQIEILNKCNLAIGSMSGAILFALACGAKTVTWGYEEEQERYYIENFTNSDLTYVSNIDIDVQLLNKIIISKL